MSDLLQMVVQIAKMKLAEFDDNTAQTYAECYPEWTSQIGKEIKVDKRVYYKSWLYKCTNTHTAQSTWTPDVSYSLFVKYASPGEEGTIDNPINYSSGMELIKDKYYIENGIKYLCTESLALSVWTLAELAEGGRYVSKV